MIYIHVLVYLSAPVGPSSFSTPASLSSVSCTRTSIPEMDCLALFTSISYNIYTCAFACQKWFVYSYFDMNSQLEGFSFTDMTSWIPVRFHMKNPEFMVWTVKRIYSVCPIFILACTISIYLLLVNTVWKACTNCRFQILYMSYYERSRIWRL